MRYLTVFYMDDRPTNITHPFNRKIDAETYANYLGDSYRVMSEDEYRKEYEKTLKFYVVCEKNGWQSKPYKRKSSADRITKAYNTENKDSGVVWKTVREDELKKETIKIPGWSDKS